MSGFVFIGGKAVPNSWVSDGKMVQVLFDTCRECEGSGVIFDSNGEPMSWCLCSTGEAVRQAGNAAGAK